MIVLCYFIITTRSLVEESSLPGFRLSPSSLQPDSPSDSSDPQIKGSGDVWVVAGRRIGVTTTSGEEEKTGWEQPPSPLVAASKELAVCEVDAGLSW